MRYTLRAALLCFACAAPALASMSATAQESHVNTARDLAANCANCHGTDGRSTNDIMPSLAGQDREKLLSTMRAYKAKELPGTIMPQLMQGYTDDELQQLATYFSAQK